MKYNILYYRLIQELSTSIISSPSIEISTSPTVLQDNSHRAKESDRDRSTKEVVQDHVKLTSSLDRPHELIFTGGAKPASHAKLQKQLATTEAREATDLALTANFWNGHASLKSHTLAAPTWPQGRRQHTSLSK